MHFSVEVSETFRHQRKNLRPFGTKHVVTETVPEPETTVFLSEPWRTKTEVFWSQVNTVSPSDVCVYIWYKANELFRRGD